MKKKLAYDIYAGETFEAICDICKEPYQEFSRQRKIHICPKWKCGVEYEERALIKRRGEYARAKKKG